MEQEDDAAGQDEHHSAFQLRSRDGKRTGQGDTRSLRGVGTAAWADLEVVAVSPARNLDGRDHPAQVGVLEWPAICVPRAHEHGGKPRDRQSASATQPIEQSTLADSLRLRMPEDRERRDRRPVRAAQRACFDGPAKSCFVVFEAHNTSLA
jgi:hypothetical protein